MPKMTPIQKRDWLLKYLLYAAVLFLGIAIGIAIRHYHNIPMIEALNIVDVASLIVTVFLAIYIPGVFDRRLEVRQDKKELLEHRIEDLQELYRTINLTVQQGQASEQDRLILRNSLDVAANRFATIVTLLEYLDLDKTFTEELDEIRSLIVSHADLLNGAVSGDGTYSQEIQAEEEQLYNRIDKDTSLLVFRISDM